MATAPTTRGPTAQWNEEETKALLTYLAEHKSEIGDGGMYKMVTFNAVASEIAKYHTSGPVKTGKMCKTKWRAVFIYLFIYTFCVTNGGGSSVQNDLQCYSEVPRTNIRLAMG